MRLLPDNPNKLNELVFENRNRSYGAYALRKNQDKRTLMGLLFACSLFLAAGTAMHFMKGGPSISIGPLLNNSEDSLISIIIENPPIDDPKDKTQITKSPKTDPGTNYKVAKKDDDSIKTVFDAKQLVQGPKSDDTTGKTGFHKGTIGVSLPITPIDTTPVI